jgi:hypothetical protein
MELSVDKVWYVHKYGTAQAYGGAEEGGWWYDEKWALMPDDSDYEPPRIFTEEEEAFAKCRELHEEEYERRAEEGANYTSVLSYQWQFFCYDVTDSPDPASALPEHRPHYE